MMEFRLDLKGLLSSWPPRADENIRAVGDGWLLSQDLAGLHAVALERISRAAGNQPGPQDKGLILLGAHGLNLCIEITGLIARGQFDIASYLLRAMLECQSLMAAVGDTEARAEDFFAGRLKAVDARKLVIETIKSAEPELADFLDQRFRYESIGANKLAHVNVLQVESVVERQGETIRPTVGGRIDGDLARRMLGAALENEYWHLVWIRAHRAMAVGNDWDQQFDDLKPRFSNFMKSVFGASGYQAQ